MGAAEGVVHGDRGAEGAGGLRGAEGAKASAWVPVAASVRVLAEKVTACPFLAVIVREFPETAAVKLALALMAVARVFRVLPAAEV